MLLFSIVWICITFYKQQPFSSIGELLTYRTGIYSTKLPEAPGSITFPAPYQADIFVDSIGVPHIYGNDEESAAFALGYMHAKDRYFQMEIITRSIQGTLSELLGKNAVSSDIYWKYLELDSLSKTILNEYKASHPGLYKCITGYAQGVNFYLEREKYDQRSPEYILLGEMPRKWEAHYSIMSAWYMSHVLSYRNTHLARADLTSSIPPELLRLLYEQPEEAIEICIPDSFFYNAPAINTTKSGKDNYIVSKTAIDRTIERNIGSNCWAVAGTKTASGNTILCNDAHLGLSIPSPWYEVQLHAPSYELHGFSVPCSPFVICGFNNSISWGITNAQWDVVDMLLLKKDNTHAGKYICDGTSMTTKQTAKTIHVKGAPDTIAHYETSQFGRVLKVKENYYAERWHPGSYNTSLLNFYMIGRSNDWKQFRQALNDYGYAPLNFLYADKSGNIGMLSKGRILSRSNSFNGGVLDGSRSPLSEWVDPGSLPAAFNPTQGYLWNANQPPARTNYYQSYEWAEGYRGKRIKQVLEENNAWTLKDLQVLQNDRKDIFAESVVKLLIKHERSDIAAWTIISPLKKWDCQMKAGTYEPVLYNTLLYCISKKMSDILSRQYRISEYPGVERIVHLLSINESFTIKDTAITTQALLEDALANCQRIMKKKYGRDFTSAKYDNTQYLSGILGIPGTGREVNNYGGSPNTVNLSIDGQYGVSMRLVVEMGDTISAFAILAGGQSGRWNSRLSANQVEGWKYGRYHRVQFEKTSTGLKKIQQEIHFIGKQ